MMPFMITANFEKLGSLTFQFLFSWVPFGSKQLQDHVWSFCCKSKFWLQIPTWAAAPASALNHAFLPVLLVISVASHFHSFLLVSSCHLHCRGAFIAPNAMAAMPSPHPATFPIAALTQQCGTCVPHNHCHHCIDPSPCAGKSYLPSFFFTHFGTFFFCRFGIPCHTHVCFSCHVLMFIHTHIFSLHVCMAAVAAIAPSAMHTLAAARTSSLLHVHFQLSCNPHSCCHWPSCFACPRHCTWPHRVHLVIVTHTSVRLPCNPLVPSRRAWPFHVVHLIAIVHTSS